MSSHVCLLCHGWCVLAFGRSGTHKCTAICLCCVLSTSTSGPHSWTKSSLCNAVWYKTPIEKHVLSVVVFVMGLYQLKQHKGPLPAHGMQGMLRLANTGWSQQRGCSSRFISFHFVLFRLVLFCFVWFCFVTYSLGCGASCDSAQMLAGKHRSLTISHLRSHNNLVNLINENHAVLLNRLHCLLLHLQYHAAQSISLFSRDTSIVSCQITETVAQQYWAMSTLLSSIRPEIWHGVTPAYW